MKAMGYSELLRHKTEDFFRWLSLRVVHHPWWAIFIMVAITGAILPAYRNMTTDFSTEAFLPTHDQVKIDYNNFREQFGQASFGLVTIETPDDVFTLENLKRIKVIQDDIEKNVPYIDEIISLVSVRHTEGNDSGLVVRDLEEVWPQTEADMPAFKKMVLANPNYVGNMVSANGRVTSLIVKVDNYSGGDAGSDDVDALMDGFDDAAPSPTAKRQTRFMTPDEEAVFTKGLIAVAEKHEVEGFKIWLNGMPVINYQMAMDMGESMMRDTALGILVLAILLACLFHRASGVVMPLLIVFLSLITTIALMPLFGFPLMGSAQILPVFLLAVGIADSMHILAVFYRRYDEGADKREAVLYAMTTTALAVLMTSVTTAAGLASFVLADLKPIQSLGIFGAIGTMLALVYTIVLLPALLMVLPIRRQAITKEEGGRVAQAILHAVDHSVSVLSRFSIRHAKAVFVVMLLLLAWSFVGISKIYFKHDPVRWYPEDHPTRVGSELIDRELSGTMTLELIFDSGQENGLYDPRFMHLLEKTEQTLLHDHARDNQQIKQTVSILGVVKENHKILNEGREDFYRIPDTREEIAQELLLFENSGSDDLEEFTDSNFRIARVSAIMPYQDMVGMQDYIEWLTTTLDQHIADSGLEGVTVHVTGLVMIFAKTLWSMLWGTISSYFQSFILVGALMFLMMGGVRSGLLAFGPNMLPVLFTIGMMGWFGIPMDILTSMVGCIIIGIAVDDTIHFMHHFRNHIAQGHDTETAIRKSFDIAGRAIVFTSIVLVGCFMVHMTDTFVSAQNFGALLSFAITAALLSNLIMVPALLKLFWKQASK